MINYNIADLVSRINNVIATNGRNSLVQVPYTKDNYQIFIQLTKLGVLNIVDNNSTSLVPQMKSQVNYITAKVQLLTAPEAAKPTIDNQHLIDQRAITQNSFANSVIESKLTQSNVVFESMKKSALLPHHSKGEGRTAQHKLKLKLISKPGRRVYVSYNDIKDFNHGFKLYLLRTSKGIISSHTAINLKIGGELLIKLTIV